MVIARRRSLRCSVPPPDVSPRAGAGPTGRTREGPRGRWGAWPGPARPAAPASSTVAPLPPPQASPRVADAAATTRARARATARIARRRAMVGWSGAVAVGSERVAEDLSPGGAARAYLSPRAGPEAAGKCARSRVGRGRGVGRGECDG